LQSLVLDSWDASRYSHYWLSSNIYERHQKDDVAGMHSKEKNIVVFTHKNGSHFILSGFSTMYLHWNE